MPNDSFLIELKPESFLIVVELVDAAARRNNNDNRIKAAYLGVLRELQKAIEDNAKPAFPANPIPAFPDTTAR